MNSAADMLLAWMIPAFLLGGVIFMCFCLVEFVRRSDKAIFGKDTQNEQRS